MHYHPPSKNIGGMHPPGMYALAIIKHLENLLKHNTEAKIINQKTVHYENIIH